MTVIGAALGAVLAWFFSGAVYGSSVGKVWQKAKAANGMPQAAAKKTDERVARGHGLTPHFLTIGVNFILAFAFLTSILPLTSDLSLAGAAQVGLALSALNVLVILPHYAFETGTISRKATMFTIDAVNMTGALVILAVFAVLL